jgi:hypothetical protein
MAKTIYRDGRAFALGVVGAAALLATMAGEYLMHNPAKAQDWHACIESNSCFDNITGTILPIPYPATAVTLLNGSAFNITRYQVIVLTLGTVILASAFACAKWATLVPRLVLAVAAVLLALTLVVFHAQAPMVQIPPIGGCDESCIAHPRLVPYAHRYPGPPAPRSLIDPFWFMAPAVALGLLATGIAFLPAEKRDATP